MLPFFTLCVVFALLGQLRWRGIVPAVFLLALLPFSNSQAEYFYRFGMFAYDLYFLSLGAASIIAGFPVFRRAPGTGYLLAFVCCVGVYALLAMANSTAVDKYFLRDLRPVIWALCMLSAVSSLRWFSSALGRPARLLRLAMLFPIGAMCWQAASWYGLIEYGDFYYEQNSYRIFTLGTYFSSVMLLGSVYVLSEKRLLSGIRQVARRDFWVLVGLCFVAIAVCGFRMPLVAIIASSAVLVARSMRAALMGTVVAVLGLLAVINVAEIAGATRVTDALGPEGILLQLEIRFAPAKHVIEGMSPLQQLLGNGFGTTFDVWWFESREMDTKTNSIDSTYLTLYAKYGAVGIAMLFVFFAGISASLPRRFRPAMMVMLLVFSFAYSVPYQGMFPGVILGIIFLVCLFSGLETVQKGGVVSGAATPARREFGHDR